MSKEDLMGINSRHLIDFFTISCNKLIDIKE